VPNRSLPDFEYFSRFNLSKTKLTKQTQY
jgi:hypothetical protein